MKTAAALRTRVALDATALGSGRGGDETYVRSMLRGLAEVCTDDEEIHAFVRPGAVAPGDDPRLTYRTIRPAGPGRLVSSLPLALKGSSYAAMLAYTHVPVGLGGAHGLVVTDLSFHHHPEYFPRSARWRLNGLVPRQAARARVVVTLSSYCRDDISASYGLDPAAIHVVPCAVETDVHVDPATELGGDRWLRDNGIDRPFVLALGNLHPRKNIVRLVRAFSSLAAARRGDVLLVVAGGRWWDGGGEDAAVEQCGGAVRMVGRVDDGIRDHLLRRAELLAYPSLFEGFGLPPLEAMAVGTPVVTSGVTALPEVVDGAAVLVDPTDTGSIAAGIDRVLHDDVLRALLRRDGLDVARRYDHRRTGEAARAALHAIVG